jgi:uncharacterized protein (DUF433 family)
VNYLICVIRRQKPYDAMMSSSREKRGAADGNAPAHLVAEAARYLRLPAATLRSWVLGRQYEGGGQFHPLIRPASLRPTLLSFSNLIEAHVLRSLRAEHAVSVKALRSALEFAEKQLGIDRLLLRPELHTDAGKVFLDRYGKLIELSASGQLVMRQAFEEHLKRIDWDSSRFPLRLFPFVSTAVPTDERPIVIDPRIAFGRPVVLRMGISTSAIADRIDAGEQVEDIAADYDLDASEINQAVLYERAA